MVKKCFMAAGVVAALFLVAIGAASCAPSDGAGGSLGQVSFSLDAKTVQSIESKVSATSRSVTYSGVQAGSELNMEISLRGDWQETAVIPVSNGSTATFDSVPAGLSVYVDTTVFKNEADGRHDLLFGRSSQFVVKSGENTVSLVLGTANPQTPNGGSGEGSGGGGGGGSGGNGSGGGGGETPPPNDLPTNLVFVANAASGGASGNEGTEASPLDSIESAVAKIHELVQDPNNFYNSGEEWGIVLLSDLEGAQKVTTDADSDVFRLYIASKEATDIKTINGGFTAAPANPSDNQTALTIESQIRYMVIQCVKITGGYAGQGGGLVHSGWNLDLMQGVEIYGNKAVSKGAGIYVQASTVWAAYLNIKGAVIRDNVCASANGSGGGVYIFGKQGSVSKKSLFTMESGSITGNKADYGAGIYAEGGCSVTIEDGTIAFNSNYTNGVGAGGGLYLSKSTDDNKPSFEIEKGAITSNVSQEVGGIYARDAQLTFSGGTISGNTASSGTGQGLYAYNSDTASISFMSWSGNVSFGANDVVYLSNMAINVSNALTSAFIATIEPATYAIDTLILVNGVKPAGYDLSSLYGSFAIKPESDGTEWHLESGTYTFSNGDLTTSAVLKH